MCVCVRACGIRHWSWRCQCPDAFVYQYIRWGLSVPAGWLMAVLDVKLRNTSFWPQNHTHLLTYLLTNLLIHYLEQSPSWEANRFSCSQEIPHNLWNPKVHYRIHSARHLSLSWAISIQSLSTHPSSWWSILILSSRLRLSLPSGIFSSEFPTKTLYNPLLYPIRATCPAYLILLDLITRKYWVRNIELLTHNYII